MLKKRYIKHPSWRVYKAVKACNLELSDFGLKDFDTYNTENKDVVAGTRAQQALYIPYDKNDDITDELCKALSDPNYKDSTYCITDCLTLFMNVSGRQLLEVMLLNGKSVSEICKTIECSEVFAMTYKSLFFDATVFTCLPDKLLYMREGTCGEDAQAKHNAEKHGEEYFKVKANLDSDKLSVDKILLDTFKTSYEYLHKNVVCDDVNSQEVSQGWANLVLKLATELRKKGLDDNDLSSIILTLTASPAPQRSIDDLD